MSGLKGTLIGILLVGLFAFALITGGITLASVNNANQSIGDDPALVDYRDELQTALETAEINANSSLEVLGDSPTTETGGAFIYDALTGTWKTLKEVPAAIYNLFVKNAKIKIFGDGFDIVFGIAAAILIIIIIFGVIALVISGRSD